MIGPVAVHDALPSGSTGLQSLPMLLLHLRETMLQPLRPVLRSFDLTEQQARVLIVLADVDAGVAEPATLARQCCLAPGSLSRILAKLEARRLVRTGAADDSPWQDELMMLTPVGVALTIELRTALRAPFAQIKRQMTEAGFARLNEALRSSIGFLGEPAMGEA